MGPATHFIIDPEQKNALFIATLNAGYTADKHRQNKMKFFHTIEQIHSKDINSESETELQQNPAHYTRILALRKEFDKQIQKEVDEHGSVTPIKIWATITDIIARIFMLEDLNAGNIVRVTSKTPSTHENFKWKLIDFYIKNTKDYYIGDIHAVTGGFINGNGVMNFTGNKFLQSLLMERPKDEKIVAGDKAIKYLNNDPTETKPGTKKMQLADIKEGERVVQIGAVTRAFNDIKKYIFTPIAEGKTRADIVGVDITYAEPDLERYKDAVLQNFANLQEGLAAELKQLAQAATPTPSPH